MAFVWGVGLTTAPRSDSPIETTLESIRRAGWEKVSVFNDIDKIGIWKSYLESLASLIREESDADAYIVFQDDILLCRNARDYLEKNLWPQERDKIALCSIYTPSVNFDPRPGWHPMEIGRGSFFNECGDLMGAQTVIFTPESIRRLVAENQGQPGEKNIDTRMGHWARSRNLTIWMHSPSLAQHIAPLNSTVDHNTLTPCRFAADFIGSEGSPREYV